jgi:GrpB-like predicted nucleotidyltransferase (UPF0157 family)
MTDHSDPRHHVEVVDYDPSWPERFERERDALEPTLAPWLAGPIEHVGSTAVPGLVAKPVIDIMVPVRTLEESRPAIASLEERHGYTYWPYKADQMHWLCKPGEFVRTHHLHLVPRGSRLFRERRLFRDALRSDQKLAGHYAALKRDLAARFPHDREAYTQGKGPFVAQALAGLGHPVVVVEHDPSWAQQFEDLGRVLAAALGDVALRIEHVGSTSVSGLAAKPIIDIDVVIEDRAKLPLRCGWGESPRR